MEKAENLSNTIVRLCREKLIQLKADLMNRLRTSFEDYRGRDRIGDETDQAVEMLAEGSFLESQTRLRNQLFEIELALGKIEVGVYGVCEETDETIEEERLLAIPWTRLSIEGAEIREDLSKRFAK